MLLKLMWLQARWRAAQCHMLPAYATLIMQPKYIYQIAPCQLALLLYVFMWHLCAMQMIYEETQGQAIITTGVGQHQMWAAQWYKFDEPRRWVSSGGLGSMGFGLPSALGAAVAFDGTDKREKKVGCYPECSFQASASPEVMLSCIASNCQVCSICMGTVLALTSQ